ncbi:MAG: ISNCY family transposase [Methylococcales bacterium]|nr:ISNCY family transposase [Methylococcales bacterium]
MSFPFLADLKPSLFNRLVEHLRSTTERFPDTRIGDNTKYSMADAAMGAFSVFFMQSPPFLDAQRTLQVTKGCNNTHTLFGMAQIPSDNHIRNLLDGVPPSELFPVFSSITDGLNAAGHLDVYRSINGDLLVALDGTQYFVSSKIHCEQCSVKHHKNGTVTYSHTAITPVIVAPGNPRVIPLEPEFITPQDGHEKQDCENTACKRWLLQHGRRYSALGVTILGDDLYCKQPLCKAMLADGLNFILVCKPDSHKTLYEWVAGLEVTQGVHTRKVVRRKGKRTFTDTYRWVEQVPLRDGKDALKVNWCELTTTDDSGKVTYKNAFATNHAITVGNVADIVRDGRARWKVENENNNTLKTKGYHLTHNFGHGKQHLSSLLATLNLLAFSFHTLLELFDPHYQLIRQFLPRKTFFDDMRALTRYLCFDNWEALMMFMMKGLELKAPNTS